MTDAENHSKLRVLSEKTAGAHLACRQWKDETEKRQSRESQPRTEGRAAEPEEAAGDGRAGKAGRGWKGRRQGRESQLRTEGQAAASGGRQKADQ